MSPKEKGKEAEKRFVEYLNNMAIPFIPIEFVHA